MERVPFPLTTGFSLPATGGSQTQAAEVEREPSQPRVSSLLYPAADAHGQQDCSWVRVGPQPPWGLHLPHPQGDPSPILAPGLSQLVSREVAGGGSRLPSTPLYHCVTTGEVASPQWLLPEAEPQGLQTCYYRAQASELQSAFCTSVTPALWFSLGGEVQTSMGQQVPEGIPWGCLPQTS